jgi:flagellar biosynthesis/type III secretory pathway chaperone
VSSLLRPTKRVKRRQLRKKSVKRLYKRKKLLLDAKDYRQRRRSAKYNVNYIKRPIQSGRQLKRHKKR